MITLSAACAGAQSAATPDSPPEGSRVIRVAMKDNVFEPRQLTVRAGEQVTIKLKNDGAVPHNLRLAGPDGRYSTGDDLVSTPEVQMPRQEGALSFAIDRPGVYQFRCDIHPIEMTGSLTVAP